MLKGEKVWYFSPQAGPYGQAGIPDRIGIVTGLFFGIECKANAQCKMTALQERCKELIEAAGGKFFLVYDKATIEEVRQWIVSARNRRQEGGSGISARHSPTCNCPVCDPESPWLGEPNSGTTYLRDDPAIKEYWARRTQPDPALL